MCKGLYAMVKPCPWCPLETHWQSTGTLWDPVATRETEWSIWHEISGTFRQRAPSCVSLIVFVWQYDFDTQPTAAQYQHWAKYASRVRELSYMNIHDADCDGCNDFSSDFWNTLARTRLDLYCIPKLNSLKWITESTSTLVAGIIFMTPHVTSIAVSIPLSLRPRLFLDEIVARMPALEVLDLRLFVPMHEVESEIIDSYQALPKLKTVRLHLSSIQFNCSDTFVL